MISPDVVVVGAGLSGLAAAVSLQQAGAQVQVIEAAEAPGGMVASAWCDGFLVERGPATMTTPGAAVMELLEVSGVWNRRIEAAPAARRRWVVHRGGLAEVPRSPGEFLRSGLLSGRGKLRFLSEALVPRRPATSERSYAALVRRRFGTEALAVLGDAFQAGIYAGDPGTLSAEHAFPRLYAADRQYPSLIRSQLAARRPPAGLWNFPDGMSDLVTGLCSRLARPVQCPAKVTGVVADGGGWRVESDSGLRISTDAVVLAVPPHALKGILRAAALPPGWDRLTQLPHAPVATVALGYARRALKREPGGLGFLVPHEEGLALLGVAYSSAVHGHRAPPDHVLLTAFLGGIRRPEIVSQDPDAIVATAIRELTPLLGIRGAPRLACATRFPLGIPQPDLEHTERLRTAAQVEHDFPGLVLAGAWQRGTGVTNALESGLAAAARTGAMVAA